MIVIGPQKLRQILKTTWLISLLIITIVWTYFIKITSIKNYWIIVEPSKTIVPKQVDFYRQDNPEWSEEKIWKTKLSLWGYGCLLSVIATSLCDLGYNTTPKELNSVFSKNNVYDENWEIIWYKIHSVIPEVDYEYKRIFSSSTIEDALEEWLLPMVKVKYHKKGAFHWVLVTWAKNWEFLVADPLESSKSLIPLDEHWKVYAYRVLVNKGKNKNNEDRLVINHSK